MPGVTKRLRISVIASTWSTGDALVGEVELEQVAQIDRRQIGDAARRTADSCE